MWIILGLVLQHIVSPCAEKTPARIDPPALIVQAVDAIWEPLPGAQVTLVPRKGKRAPGVYSTSDGSARFWDLPDGEYSVEVKLTGFKTVRAADVHVRQRSVPSSTAYVHVQLHVSGPMVEVWHD